MVEFSEVFTDSTKFARKIKKGDYLESGIYPIIDQGQEFVIGYTNDEKGLYKDVPAIIFGDHTRIIKYIDRPFFIGADGVKVLRTKIDDVDYKYLYYALRNIDIINTGYNRHFKWLKESKIKLPDLKDQQKIATILDSIENIVNLKNVQLQEYDQLIKSRFVEMFGDQNKNPFKWNVKTIGETCKLKSGNSLPLSFENEGGPIPYIKVGDMNLSGNGKYITNSSRYVTVKTAGKGVFDIGTIIFPKRGGAIGTNKKRMTISPICADLNVMGVTPLEKLNSHYLLAYFDEIDMGSLNNGSSVPQINNLDIAPLRICLPPMELQNQFGDFVQQVDKLKFEDDC